MNLVWIILFVSIFRLGALQNINMLPKTFQFYLPYVPNTQGIVEDFKHQAMSGFLNGNKMKNGEGLSDQARVRGQNMLQEFRRNFEKSHKNFGTNFNELSSNSINNDYIPGASSSMFPKMPNSVPHMPDINNFKTPILNQPAGLSFIKTFTPVNINNHHGDEMFKQALKREKDIMERFQKGYGNVMNKKIDNMVKNIQNFNMKTTPVPLPVSEGEQVTEPQLETNWESITEPQRVYSPEPVNEISSKDSSIEESVAKNQKDITVDEAIRNKYITPIVSDLSTEYVKIFHDEILKMKDRIHKKYFKCSLYMKPCLFKEILFTTSRSKKPQMELELFKDYILPHSKFDYLMKSPNTETKPKDKQSLSLSAIIPVKYARDIKSISQAIPLISESLQTIRNTNCECSHCKTQTNSQILPSLVTTSQPTKSRIRTIQKEDEKHSRYKRSPQYSYSSSLDQSYLTSASTSDENVYLNNFPTADRIYLTDTGDFSYLPSGSSSGESSYLNTQPSAKHSYLKSDLSAEKDSYLINAPYSVENSYFNSDLSTGKNSFLTIDSSGGAHSYWTNKPASGKNMHFNIGSDRDDNSAWTEVVTNENPQLFPSVSTNTFPRNSEIVRRIKPKPPQLDFVKEDPVYDRFAYSSISRVPLISERFSTGTLKSLPIESKHTFSVNSDSSDNFSTSKDSSNAEIVIKTQPESLQSGYITEDSLNSRASLTPERVPAETSKSLSSGLTKTFSNNFHPSKHFSNSRIPSNPEIVSKSDTQSIFIKKDSIIRDPTKYLSNSRIPPTPEASSLIPEVVSDTPEVVPDTPEAVPETPEVVSDTPEVVPDTLEAVPETPEVVPGTPDVALIESIKNGEYVDSKDYPQFLNSTLPTKPLPIARKPIHTEKVLKTDEQIHNISTSHNQKRPKLYENDNDDFPDTSTSEKVNSENKIYNHNRPEVHDDNKKNDKIFHQEAYTPRRTKPKVNDNDKQVSEGENIDEYHMRHQPHIQKNTVPVDVEEISVEDNSSIQPSKHVFFNKELNQKYLKSNRPTSEEAQEFVNDDEFSIHKPTQKRPLSSLLKKSSNFEEFDEDLTDNKDDCTPSVTYVQGRQMCKKQLIFEEKFQSLRSRYWTVEQRIAGQPDYEFVVYVNRPETIEISENNHLSIKPVMTEDIFGPHSLTEDLDLGENCTEKEDNRACRIRGDTVFIVPPIASAKLSTKHKFSFKYGTVEIRAKLPAGDWIYPILYLNPENDTYGKWYKSGQMRIAFTDGNSDRSKLLCGGIILGDSPKARSYGMKTLNNTIRWTHDYHVYSLKWTPESITVSVNNIEYGKIKPPNEGFSSLVDTLNIPYIDGHKWKSTLAPFDQEMYLQIGLGVGGFSFEDRRNSGKPWRNKERQQIKKFYDDDQWKTTWKEGENILKIDYVKIWAL